MVYQSPQDCIPSNQITVIALSPKGSHIAGICGHQVLIWAIPSACLLKTISHRTRVTCLVFSPNGELLITGEASGEIHSWNVRTGKKDKTFNQHESEVTAIVTPDNDTLISASHDKTIRIWQLPTGKLNKTLKNHSQAVNCLALSPSGEILCSGSNDQTVRLWLWKEGKNFKTIKEIEKPIIGIAIDAKAKAIIALSSDKVLHCWKSEKFNFSKIFWEIILNTGLGVFFLILAFATSFISMAVIGGFWFINQTKGLKKDESWVDKPFKKNTIKVQSHNPTKISIDSGNLITDSRAYTVVNQGGKIELKSSSQVGLVENYYPGKLNQILWQVHPDRLYMVGDHWGMITNGKGDQLIKILEGSLIPLLAQIHIIKPEGTFQPDHQYQFLVNGQDQNRQKINITSPISWQADQGVIDQQGKLTTPKQECSITITAKVGFVSATLLLPIQQQAYLAQLKIKPSGNSRFMTGDRIHFQAQGFDQRGQMFPIDKIQWSVNGSKNFIDQSGLLIVGSTAGTFKITAKVNSLTTTRDFAVYEKPFLSRLTINVSQSSFYPNQSTQLSVEGCDQYGNKFPVDDVD